MEDYIRFHGKERLDLSMLLLFQIVELKGKLRDAEEGQLRSSVQQAQSVQYEE